MMNELYKDETGDWTLIENGFCPDYQPQRLVQGRLTGRVLFPRNFIESENWKSAFKGTLTKEQRTAILIFDVVWFDGIRVHAEGMSEEDAARATAKRYNITIKDTKRILNKYRFRGNPYFKV